MKRKLVMLLCAAMSLSVTMPVHAQELVVTSEESQMVENIESETSTEEGEISNQDTDEYAALAGELTSSDGKYKYTVENGNATITKYLGSETVVIIPNSIDGKPVTAMGNSVFYNKTELTKITIPSSVTSFGWDTFSGCWNLSEYTYEGNPKCRLTPDGTFTISGSGSMDKFSNGYLPYEGLQNKVEKAVVESGVTNIKGAFRNCANLKSASIANSVTNMDGAFSDCTSLTAISIPNSVTNIDSAFSGCIKLASVSIPNSVTTMYSAFYGCKSLTSVTIPNSVTTMDNAFSECTGLTNVTIPGNVTSMGSTFSGCTALREAVLQPGIKEISYRIFEGCNKLESVEIPQGVKIIQWNAFTECKSLASINIPDSITNISSQAFKNCTKLTSFTASNATIGYSCFEGCTSLELVKCKASSWDDIPKEAFKNCTALKEVTINGCGRSYVWSSIDSPDTINEGAFTGCTNLTKLTIPDTVKTIDIHAFRYCDKLQTIVVHGEPRSLSDYTVKEYNDAFKRVSFANEPHDETSEVTKTPSEWLTGTRTYTCRICGDKREEEIPKLVDDTVDPSTLHCKWYNKGGKSYWYENGVRQGTYDDPNGVMGDGSIRGREICDMESAGWYWLDSVYDGAKAINKEVWMPYIYQQEKSWSDAEIKMNAQASGNMAEQVERDIKAHTGKWVRYDANGAMYKGWYTVEGQQASIYPKQEGNTYYYDPKTGLMAKGDLVIDGVSYHFDETTGVLQK